jgi:hypothetical protein
MAVGGGIGAEVRGASRIFGIQNLEGVYMYMYVA